MVSTTQRRALLPWRRARASSFRPRTWGPVAELGEAGPDPGVVVASVETEAGLDAGRPGRDQRVERRHKQGAVVSVRARDHDGERQPSRVGQQASLRALLGSISGIRAGRLATLRRLDHLAVQRQPGPIDPGLWIGQQGLPELLEHTSAAPLAKASIRRRQHGASYLVAGGVG